MESMRLLRLLRSTCFFLFKSLFEKFFGATAGGGDLRLSWTPLTFTAAALATLEGRNVVIGGGEVGINKGCLVRDEEERSIVGGGGGGGGGWGIDETVFSFLFLVWVSSKTGIKDFSSFNNELLFWLIISVLSEAVGGWNNFVLGIVFDFALITKEDMFGRWVEWW